MNARSRHGRQRAATRKTAPPMATPGCVAAQVFDHLWMTLADAIGSTATAALIQRSAKRAAAEQPELLELTIVREQFVYTYTLPPSWSRPRTSTRAVAGLVQQLWPLLSELTGSVLIRRLQGDPFLRGCGVLPKDGQP